jgi:hypothetical protein
MLTAHRDYLDHLALMRRASQAFPDRARDELQDDVVNGRLTFAEIPGLASGEMLRDLAVKIIELFDCGKQSWNFETLRLCRIGPGFNGTESGVEGAIENGDGEIAVTDGRTVALVDDYILQARDDERLNAIWSPMLDRWRGFWAAELRYFNHARQAIAARTAAQGGAE